MANVRNGVTKETRSPTNDGNESSASKLFSSSSASSSNDKDQSTGKSKSKNVKNCNEKFTKELKNHCAMLKQKDDKLFSNFKTESKPGIALIPLNTILDPKLDRISSVHLEDEMERVDVPD
eukprot:scaffold291259_cov50-Attheya_sp.AAC.1